jgi:hypothetical protein
MKECDFVCLQHNQIINVIQVCEFLTPENYARETEGLLEAMVTYHLSEGTILTRGKSEIISLPASAQSIRVINIIDWLL